MTTLSDIARITSGGTPSKSNITYWNGTIPWLSPKEMNSFRGTTEAQVTTSAIGNGTRLSGAPSIFIAVRGMSLHNEIRIAYSEKAIAFNQDVKAIEVLKGDPKYIYYHLLASRPQFLEKVESSGHGTGVLPTEILSSYELFLPPLPEQKRIAHILGSLDDKIELNRQMNETLEAMAQALFQDWFVDFGPTRAKMEGRDPYLAPEIWELFPDTLGEDGVPVGWEVVPADHLIEFNPKERLSKGAEAPYLDMAALPTVGSTPEASTLRSYTSGMRFRNGDALLARITPCLENGKTAYVQNLPADSVGWGSTEFIVMRAKTPVPPVVSYLLARTPEFRDHAIRSMSGTSGRQRARAEALKGFMMVQPPTAALWEGFGAVCAEMFLKIQMNWVEAQALAEAREGLLGNLFG